MQQTTNSNDIVRTVLIGPYGVGKSSLARRFLNGDFVENEPSTIGLDFFSYTFPDMPERLYVWDTAGHERFHAITTVYYRLADMYIIVFNVCERETFDAAMKYIQIATEFKPTSPIIIIGNMAHADEKNTRVVTRDDVAEWLSVNDNNRVTYEEISAKHDDLEAIRNLFKTCLCRGLEHKRIHALPTNDGLRTPPPQEAGYSFPTSAAAFRTCC
jgi:small GTP-binding protein